MSDTKWTDQSWKQFDGRVFQFRGIIVRLRYTENENSEPAVVLVPDVKLRAEDLACCCIHLECLRN